MYRWTFYAAVGVGGALLFYWIARLLGSSEPVLVGGLAPNGAVHPWILQIYQILRSYEGILYALLALGLTPRILGLRPLQPQFQLYRPANGAVWRSSLWHLAVASGVGYLIYVGQPWASPLLGENLLPTLTVLGRLMRHHPPFPAMSTLWMAGQAAAVLLIYLIVHRNPHRSPMGAATLFLVAGIALFTLVPTPWPWSGQVVLFSFLAPQTVLTLYILGRWLRAPDRGAQPGAFMLLVGLSLPVVGLTYWLLHAWPAISCQLTRFLPAYSGGCPSSQELARALDDWSFVMGLVAILLFFLSIGIAVRRSEPGVTLIPAWIRRFALPRLTYHLPKRSYPRIEIDPPQTGWSAIDVPVLIVVRLIQQLANTVLATAQTLDNVATIVLDGLLHLGYTAVSLVYHLILHLAVHTVYTMIQLPRLLLRSLGEILDSVDLVLRELFLPLAASYLAAMGLAVFIDTGVSYFLTGHPRLLSWNLLGAYTLLLGILVTLSAVAWAPFSHVLAWYLLSLIEWLSYPLVVSVAFLWMAIWLGPRFGIQHFRPGPITWTLTTVLALVLILGIVLGRRSSHTVQSESIPAE